MLGERHLSQTECLVLAHSEAFGLHEKLSDQLSLNCTETLMEGRARVWSPAREEPVSLRSKPVMLQTPCGVVLE